MNIKCGICGKGKPLRRYRYCCVEKTINVSAIMLPYAMAEEERIFRQFYMGNPYAAENILKR
jgi:hypothetical protein